jgi:hypothetical protein
MELVKNVGSPYQLSCRYSSFSGLAIAAVSYGAYCGYREFGFIMPAIVIFVLVQTVAIVVYQYRKLKRSDPQVWDWWGEEIKE